MVKVLLDTDIGSDVDDAVCLAYLLAQPKCRLLGITTVSGEPEKRAMLASALCKVAGKSVPIHAGADGPLLGPSGQPRAPQAEALHRWEHDTHFPRGEAIEFMRQTVRKNPGEVVLLTIGPLTNVALLFKVDPEIPALLKGLVMMAGAFRGRFVKADRAEWNAYCDPYAAAAVYTTPVRTHRSVGLDVTRHVIMDAAQVRQRFRHELLRPVLDFAEVWFRQREGITFHDPLAAATVFDGHICTFERGNVEVELASERLRGVTTWEQDSVDGRHEVALKVDSARFFDHYFSVFS